MHPALIAENVTTAATSAMLTCASVSGALTCFGRQAKAIGNVQGVVSLAMNDTIGCAVTASGELLCFATSWPPNPAIPRVAMRIENIAGALDVVLGAGLVCARTASDVRCFAPRKPQEPLLGLTDVVEIASTSYAICTLSRNGEARCNPGLTAKSPASPPTPGPHAGVAKIAASNHAYWPRSADGVPVVPENLPKSIDAQIPGYRTRHGG